MADQSPPPGMGDGPGPQLGEGLIVPQHVAQERAQKKAEGLRADRCIACGEFLELGQYLRTIVGHADPANLLCTAVHEVCPTDHLTPMGIFFDLLRRGKSIEFAKAEAQKAAQREEGVDAETKE